MSTPSILPSVDSSRSEVGRRAAFHIERLLRQYVRGDRVVNGPDYFRLITGEPHPLGNLVTLPMVTDRSRIEPAIAPLRHAAFPSAVIFPEGIDEAAKSVVLAAGYGDAGPMPAMAVDIDRLAPTRLPTGYTCSRVGIGAGGEAWADALAEGYGIPLKVARLFSPATIQVDSDADAALQFFAVHRHGRIVATALLYLADGVAGIYCVATLKEERGQGLGAHVTAEALRAAGRLGYRVGVLQSSEDGHPVYRRLGFEDVGNVPMFVRVPT
ncbi:MAG: GNAT family N-acetyltransferase [Opitutaceae bacterium]